MVNAGLILCGEHHKAEENLSITFMHYVSYGGHMIQGEKAWFANLENEILVLILPLYNLISYFILGISVSSFVK